MTTISLDLSSLNCPEPILLLRKKMKELNEGELIEVIATDETTQYDIPLYCQHMGHQLIKQTHNADLPIKNFIYLIQKGKIQ